METELLFGLSGNTLITEEGGESTSMENEDVQYMIEISNLPKSYGSGVSIISKHYFTTIRIHKLCFCFCSMSRKCSKRTSWSTNR